MKRFTSKMLIITVLATINSFQCFSQNIDYYNIAYSKIETMLAENSNSFKDAVFAVENAYFDNQLDIDFYYKKIERYADFCVGIKESGNVMYDGKGKDRDKALMQYSVFAFFTEKIPIINEEQIDTVYPFKYNYEDFAGKNDWSNMFVTKLMQTKQGNCHSLPYLYKIIMDELGEESYLSLCPNHLYIKVRNEKVGWHNIELTNSNFPTDAYLMSSGYVHIDAIRNGIYMKALTQQESIALCLIDLAQGYIAKFGIDDGEFVLKCCETALKYFPDCITAMLLKSRILAEEYQSSDAKNDEQFAELTELTTKIHKLGYRKMPDRMYQNWLNRMQSEESERDLYGLEIRNITAAQANTKNPFAEYGLDKSKMIRTAAETVFEEFFDLEDTVELGNVYFNIRTYEIVGFIPAEKLKNEVAVDLIAISIDPKADLYWWVSPYAYCLNNPVKYVDPTGMSAEDPGDGNPPKTEQVEVKTPPPPKSETKETPQPEIKPIEPSKNPAGDVLKAGMTLAGIAAIDPIPGDEAFVFAGALIFAAAVWLEYEIYQLYKEASSNSNNGGQVKGERGQAKSASGTSNPYKHMKPDPNKPGNVIVKDPHTGKSLSKPAPPGYTPK